MIFHDRIEAARALANRLRSYEGTHPLVLALPRGGVPMGRVIADALHGELDVVQVRKIGAPGNAEFAIGSVSEFGGVYLSDAARMMNIDRAFIDAVAKRELETMKRRRASYSALHEPISPTNRTVIIVDD